MYDRNNIEKQAILALKTIATIILFIVDPTLASGYDVENQISLYKELHDNFAKDMQIPIKVIINKIDFASADEIQNVVDALQIPLDHVIQISAKTGENVDQVKKFLLDYFRSTNFSR
jgi:nucleolar GTP-binding protein